MNASTLQYPIGTFEKPLLTGPEQRAAWISDLERLPGNLSAALAALRPAQLEMPYRPGGWTVRQVIHHLADSHMNSYARFRLALTESSPVIKPYNEAAWAELADARSAPAELSLALLDALHQRWTFLLRSLPAADFERPFLHPELGQTPLHEALALYAWHGKHHLAQILSIPPYSEP